MPLQLSLQQVSLQVTTPSGERSIARVHAVDAEQESSDGSRGKTEGRRGLALLGEWRKCCLDRGEGSVAYVRAAGAAGAEQESRAGSRGRGLPLQGEWGSVFQTEAGEASLVYVLLVQMRRILLIHVRERRENGALRCKERSGDSAVETEAREAAFVECSTLLMHCKGA